MRYEEKVIESIMIVRRVRERIREVGERDEKIEREYFKRSVEHLLYEMMFYITKCEIEGREGIVEWVMEYYGIRETGRRVKRHKNYIKEGDIRRVIIGVLEVREEIERIREEKVEGRRIRIMEGIIEEVERLMYKEIKTVMKIKNKK
jgi:hypothetical protein